MSYPLLWPLSCVAALSLMPWMAQAQSGHAGGASTPAPATSAASRIDKVTLYPGSATVERLAQVAAGSRSYTFDCLPAALDTASVQAMAGPQVRLGETHIERMDRDIAPRCASALEARWQQAQDAVAQAQARTQSLELAHRYLQSVAKGPGEEGGLAAPASASALVGTAQALRQQSQEQLLQLHQAQRQLQEAQRDLKALAVERERLSSAQAQVSRVTVTLATAQDAELRLSYQVRGPSWSPSYRASLDSASAQLRLERLALVTQNTGEDWAGVALTLSTGAPLRATRGALPRPWTVDVAPPPIAMAAPAPAPSAPMPKLARSASLMAAEASAPASAEDLPVFDAQPTEQRYASRFALPQRIHIASGGPQVTLSLGQQSLSADLIARAAPAVEENAYLVARFAAPAGVWPPAAVALYRDGAFVGNGRFDSAELADLGLSFGRDERLRVRAEAVREHRDQAGLTGSTTVRQWQRSYHIDNLHNQAVRLQVIDSAPVSRHGDIRVQSSYAPEPTSLAWQGQEGRIAWEQSLAAGASAQWRVEHQIRYPQELRIQERH